MMVWGNKTTFLVGFLGLFSGGYSLVLGSVISKFCWKTCALQRVFSKFDNYTTIFWMRTYQPVSLDMIGFREL